MESPAPASGSAATPEPGSVATPESGSAPASAPASAPQVTPARIMEVGMGFWPAKTLLSAVELGLFTVLGEGARTGSDLEEGLGLHPRATLDFLDGLVAMGFLEREGLGKEARYANTPDTATFLDRNGEDYVGGLLEMANSRLYPFWGDLTEGLRTGKPQNEIKHTGEPMFDELYSDPARLEQFMRAMEGASKGNFRALAEAFDFSRYRTLCDVGGATGLLSRTVAARHPHLRCITCDLPPVEPIARRSIDAAGLEDRVEVCRLDFFRDPIPEADVVTMGMILHDWNLEGKMHLLRSAWDALPEGGALIAIEHLIDDERRENVFGLMMSLNMLVEFGDSFDFTGADYDGWCREVGFRRTEVIPLAGPASAAVAYK